MLCTTCTHATCVHTDSNVAFIKYSTQTRIISNKQTNKIKMVICVTELKWQQVLENIKNKKKVCFRSNGENKTYVINLKTHKKIICHSHTNTFLLKSWLVMFFFPNIICYYFNTPSMDNIYKDSCAQSSHSQIIYINATNFCDIKIFNSSFNMATHRLSFQV